MAEMNGDSYPKAEKVEHGDALKEISSIVDPKVALLLTKLLGKFEIRSKGPVKGHYVAVSDDYGLVAIKVDARDLVRVHKVSSFFFNQVIVKPGGLYLDYHPRLTDLFDKGKYTKIEVGKLFSKEDESPQHLRIRRAMLTLNLRPSGKFVNFVQYPKSPISFVLKGVLKNQPIPANFVYYGNLPSGLDVFLTHESKIGKVALANILVPWTDERPKVRMLESKADNAPNLNLLSYLLSLRENA